MREILLVRHAQSYANKRDTAFGNAESPLTERGVEQATALAGVFEEDYGIVPSEYNQPVLASSFLRPQQTAQYAGFMQIHRDRLINESDVPPELLKGNEVIKKHALERWVPEELQDRAKRFVSLVRSGDLEYQIYFSHGFFIAAVLTELSDQNRWDEGRGFIPRLATIVPVKI